MPIYISVPAKIKNDYIANIQLRVGQISQSTSLSGDIIAELDDLGFTYETLFDLDEFEIPE
jgi:hypothetical protein